MKQTLDEFAIGGLETVWYVSPAAPAGDEYTHDVGTEVDEDYLDLDECYRSELSEIWGDLVGEVSDDGSEWRWDGEGDPVDPWRNTLQSLKAWRRND